MPVDNDGRTIRRREASKVLATEPTLIAEPIAKLCEPQPSQQLGDSASARCPATALDPNAQTNACAEQADST
jgi:hypothetical protein